MSSNFMPSNSMKLSSIKSIITKLNLTTMFKFGAFLLLPFWFVTLSSADGFAEQRTPSLRAGNTIPANPDFYHIYHRGFNGVYNGKNYAENSVASIGAVLAMVKNSSNSKDRYITSIEIDAKSSYDWTVYAMNPGNAGKIGGYYSTGANRFDPWGGATEYCPWPITSWYAQNMNCSMLNYWWAPKSTVRRAWVRGFNSAPGATGAFFFPDRNSDARLLPGQYVERVAALVTAGLKAKNTNLFIDMKELRGYNGWANTTLTWDQLLSDIKALNLTASQQSRIIIQIEPSDVLIDRFRGIRHIDCSSDRNFQENITKTKMNSLMEDIATKIDSKGLSVKFAINVFGGKGSIQNLFKAFDNATTPNYCARLGSPIKLTPENFVKGYLRALKFGGNSQSIRDHLWGINDMTLDPYDQQGFILFRWFFYGSSLAQQMKTQRDRQSLFSRNLNYSKWVPREEAYGVHIQDDNTRPDVNDKIYGGFNRLGLCCFQLDDRSLFERSSFMTHLTFDRWIEEKY